VTLAEDYAVCRAITQARGANFAIGLRCLPGEKRRAAEAVYAFCRQADDIADEDPIAAAEGGPASVLERLSAWEEELDRAYGGRPETPVGRALADAVRRFPIAAEPFRRLLAGGRRDQEHTRCANDEDFLDYCRLVAWSISDLTLPIFGYSDDRARVWGQELSTALQRTNVLRDVVEDAGRDRVYLPADARARHGVSEDDLLRSPAPRGLLALMKEEIAKAHEAFRRAEPLISAIRADARMCVALLGGVYRAILGKIERDLPAALARRVALTPKEKFWLLVRAAPRAAAGRWP
jgi:phytoene synthase